MSVSPRNSTDFSDSSQSSSGQGFADLLALARNGSPASLGRLFERNRKYLLTLANRRMATDLQGKIGASDLVQDTFVEAQRDFERFEGTTEREFLTWLFGILASRFSKTSRHHRLSQKRAISREANGAAANIALSHLADDLNTPSTNAAAEEDRQRLHAALNRLPSEVREVLVRRIWQQASFAEIGDSLGCSTEAARKRFLRAIEELQALLD
jgi:RNA polymerase sigma-70 factor (ECF subfamily)